MEEEVITIDDSSNGFVDAMSATHNGEQKLLPQAKRDDKVKADADTKAQAAVQSEAAKADTQKQESGKKSDSSSDVELPIDIPAKALYCSMTADA